VVLWFFFVVGKFYIVDLADCFLEGFLLDLIF